MEQTETSIKINNLADQIASLTVEEQCQLIMQVPQLLRLDEEFILQRRKEAQKAFKLGNVVDGFIAIARAKERREV